MNESTQPEGERSETYHIEELICTDPEEWSPVALLSSLPKSQAMLLDFRKKYPDDKYRIVKVIIFKNVVREK